MAGGSRGLAPAVAGAYVLIIASPNLPNPILPLYADLHGLRAADVAGIFSSYLVALVVLLGVTARPQLQRRPRLILPLALAIAVTADPVMASGTVPALYAGRILSAVAVGLGTGAAAALMVAAAGERGRTISATGNLLGALTGTLIMAGAAELLPLPTVTGYVLHAAAGVTVLAVLIAVLRGLRLKPFPTAVLDGGGPKLSAVLRTQWRAFLLGVLAWSAGGIVLVLAPAALRGFTGSPSILAGSLAILVFFAASSAGQFTLAHVRHAQAATLAAMVLGLLLIVSGLAVPAVPLVLSGAAITGFGQGAAYRVGLAAVTLRLSPARQGAVSSTYAGVAYGVSAPVVLGCGVLANALGTAPGLAVSCVLFCGVAAAALGAMSRPRRTPAAAVSTSVEDKPADGGRDTAGRSVRVP
jgi:hypothetical protein